MGIRLLTNLEDTTDGGGPYTSAAFTPVADSYVCAFVVVSDSTTFNSATMASSVAGKTFTRNTQQARFAASAHSIHFFHMDQAASPVSQTAAVSFSDAGTGCQMAVLELTGVAGYGASGIRSAGARSNATDAASVTYGSSAVTNGQGIQLGCIAGTVNPLGVTHTTGWTELIDDGLATPDIGYQVQGVDNDNRILSTNIVWGSNVAVMGGYAFEFHGSASGGAAVIGRRRRNWMRGRG